jgi:hypothetical protein
MTGMKFGFAKARLVSVFTFALCALCIGAFSAMEPSSAAAREFGCPCCSVPASQCVACAVGQGHPRSVAIAWCKRQNR